MRDYRDAKGMARRLREALAQKNLSLTHTDCLELVARSFGLKDWQVLSSLIETEATPGASTFPSPAVTGFRKIDADVAVSDEGFIVRAGKDIEYVENGIARSIDAVHAQDGAILLYAHASGFRAIPGGSRIYQNVARALAFLGKQPELWIVGAARRHRGSSLNPAETAPRDGSVVWGDFRNEATGGTTRWAVAWDSVTGDWVTRLGRAVKSAWRMEGWEPAVELES